MFQYAFARRIQLRLGVPLRLDVSILLDPKPPAGYIKRAYNLDLFQLRPEFHVSPRLLQVLYAPNKYRWSQYVRQLAQRGYPVYEEQDFSVNQTLLDAPPDNVIYRGYWQSERYFQDIAETIRKDFTFRQPILPRSTALARELRQRDSVCLNVRRTDLLQSPTHNVTDKNYFENCLRRMKELRPAARFYLFSDDLDWCREAFGARPDVAIVEHEHAGPQFGNYLHLMHLCEHFIIPNSTFAWWAAWLGEQKSSIIMAPERWFGTDQYDYRDVVPERWLKMPN